MNPDYIRRRDAGLRRISNMTKGALAGGLILTGGLSALAARSFSGTTTATAAATQRTATQSTTQSATQSTAATTEQNDDDQQTLQAPSYSIQSSRSSGRVSSGGS